MAGSISGTSIQTFNVRGKDFVSVVIERKRAGSFTVTGFTNDDDNISIGPESDYGSLTKGMYGNISMNVFSNVLGTVTLKLLEAHDDNFTFATWLEEQNAGSVDPAIITISTAKAKHKAFNCVPIGLGPATPGSEEDPGVEWRFQAGSVQMNIPI